MLPLTTDQYATLFNVTGVMIVLGLSLVPLRRMSTPFFRNWTIAYFCGLCMTSVEFVASLIERHGPINYVSVGVIALDALLVANTAWTLRTGHGFAPRKLLGVWGLVCFGAFIGLAQGLPFIQAALIPALGLAFSFMWLGTEVFVTRRTSGKRGAVWLGIPTFSLGLWVLTYPFISSSTASWLGYWISGLLNLWVGAGMLVFLLLEMAETLKNTNAELHKLDALKTNFLNTISHEIRTPLTTIRAATFIMDKGSSEDREQYKAMIEANTSQLDRLLGDILDFAKLETKMLSFNRETLDLGDLAVRARDMYAPTMKEKGLEFVADIQESPIPVHVDYERLLQVFSNLLNNASKFTPAGGRISFSAGAADGLARVVVCDTGIGIPVDALPLVFDKFFQVENGMTRRYGGAGLGLAISKTIVEDGHSGKIYVSSVVGEGSKFVVEIPLATPS